MLTAVCLPSVAEEVTDEQVLETFKDYMGAMRDGEYKTMAGYIHPGELDDFKKLFVTLGESAQRQGDFAEFAAFLGVETLEELKQTPSNELFAKLFEVITQIMPEFQQMLKSAKVNLLGQVTEGEGKDEVVHLVFRVELKMNGATIKSVDTAAMSKADDGKYYFMIGEEVQGLVNALKNQFGGLN
jgi:hypothetical protein